MAGDPNISILEKIWLRPAITIIGLDACELNKAANKVLSYATARISVRYTRSLLFFFLSSPSSFFHLLILLFLFLLSLRRIVADQDPDHVLKVLKAHLTKHTPYGAHVSFSKEVLFFYIFIYLFYFLVSIYNYYNCYIFLNLNLIRKR